jgi:asparagine synthase (glutamine-hydrolysing)
MVYDLRENKSVMTSYYSLFESVNLLQPEDDIERFLELLQDSICLRLRSDVPVGTCLSGGLDSSSIFSIASKFSDNKLFSYSAYFSGEEFDESPFFNAVLDQYPAHEHKISPSYDNFEVTLKEIIYSLEEPTLAMGVFPQWHVMKQASQDVKVLLDGQGGDEVLAGYDLYYDYHLLDTLINKPHDFLKVYRENRTGRYGISGAKKGLIKNALRSLIKEKRVEKSFLKSRLITDVTQTLLPALLKYEDKLGMAFSVEARLPFLDYRLVDYVFSQSTNLLINNGWSKWALRESMIDILPDQVRLRTDKKGFPTPFNEILNNNPSLKQLIPTKYSDEWKSWRYVSLELWRELFF